MPNRLYSLTYLSRLQVPDTRAALHASVLDILAVSRRNNRRLGITGALLMSVTGFGQVLEGRNADLQKVFGDIQRDTRHFDVTVLSEQGISERSFGEWSMAFVQGPDDEGGALGIDIPDALTIGQIGTSLEAQRIITALRVQMGALVAGGRLIELPEELSGL